MATPTNLTVERFIEEIKAWGATEGSLIKVRMMRKGDTVHCRLILPNNGEVIQTSFPHKRYAEFEFVNFAIAVPAVWEDETEQIKKLNKKLDESINANTQHITPNSYQNIRY